MDYFVISEKDVENAKTYVGLSEKQEFASYAAAGCFEPLSIRFNDEKKDEEVPPMYKERTDIKSRYLMGAFVRLYLGKEYVPVDGDKWLMSQDDYDRYAGSHIFNQIERFKSNAKLRDVCFDLMQDYKDLEKRLNAEVFGLLQVMNDPISRFVKHMRIVASPDNMKSALSEMEKVKTELYDIVNTSKE